MFYEVRVLDSRGKVKKTISGKELSRRYWSDFQDHQETANLPPLNREGRRPGNKPKKPAQGRRTDKEDYDA